MADHQIFIHEFQYILGEVPVRQMGIEVVRKRGEDGHIRREIGERSEEFTVVAAQHYPSLLLARNGFELYSEMNQLGRLQFIKDGVNYRDLLIPYDVVVVTTKLRSLKLHNCIAGTSNKAWLETLFTLILVPII